jgi:outer membrane receptor protein involved in Fe transport
MMYVTWSEGYRPGGINRNPFAGDYKSDFLTNYEFGWKTEWFNRTLQFNGALFLQKWKDFQIGFQGANGITQVDNGPSAEVKGAEIQLMWLASENLLISTSTAFYKSKLKSDYSNFDAAGNVVDVNAPAGTRLPITPKFKGSLLARYKFNVGDYEGHVQGSLAHSGSAASRLNIADNAVVGDIEANTTLDVSTGVERGNYSLELFVQNLTNENASLYKTAQCTDQVCGGVQSYGVRPRPRTIGIKFNQKF